MNNNDNPLISIVVRTCPGRKGCLTKAIDSVINQTYRPIEIVIVEDGGSKASGLVGKIEESHGISVNYIPIAKAGRCIAGNVGMESSSGEYLCFLDDDDELYANHCEVLATQISVDDQVHAACALTHEIVTSIESYTPFIYKEFDKYVRFNRDFSREALWIGNYLPIQSVLFKKSLYLEYGGFDTNFEVLEDWDLWVRYSCNNKFVSVPEITSMYRVPYENEKRKQRESSFRDNYINVIDKQRELRTVVDKTSYMAIVRVLLSSYLSLAIMEKMKIISFDKLCQIESKSFSEVQEEFLNISPREAVIKANQRLARNRVFRFSTIFENRAKSKINYILGLFNK